MNELIREIAREAEFSEKDLHWQADNFQKFAEMIVQECVNIAYKEGDNVAYLALYFGRKENE